MDELQEQAREKEMALRNRMLDELDKIAPAALTRAQKILMFGQDKDAIPVIRDILDRVSVTRAKGTQVGNAVQINGGNVQLIINTLQEIERGGKT
jgi:hypothetical protein